MQTATPERDYRALAIQPHESKPLAVSVKARTVQEARSKLEAVYGVGCVHDVFAVGVAPLAHRSAVKLQGLAEAQASSEASRNLNSVVILISSTFVGIALFVSSTLIAFHVLSARYYGGDSIMLVLGMLFALPTALLVSVLLSILMHARLARRSRE